MRISVFSSLFILSRHISRNQGTKRNAKKTDPSEAVKNSDLSLRDKSEFTGIRHWALGNRLVNFPQCASVVT